MKHYDFIICGGGMSGLSLAYYLSKSKLKEKSVLIIEPEEKNKNDRTWAFWEENESDFEEILYKKWDRVRFTTLENEKKILDIGNYKYKLLRGIDFYDFTISEIKKNLNFEWLNEKVVSIEEKGEWRKEKGENLIIEAESQTFSCEFCFDSTYKLKLNLQENHNILQHFKGFVIKTDQTCFDVSIPDMMNFSVPQKNDECRFMYILPFSKNTALIEYTLFSEKLLEEKEYDSEINDFIKNNLQLTDYQILESEFGIIPMTDEPTNENPTPHVIRIGTAGGYTNPATGYTFQDTQKRLKRIVENLEKNGSPIVKRSFWQRRFLFYSSVLLNVLQKKRHPLADVFDKMYSKNPPSRVFRFLDGETNFFEEIMIMWSTPKSKFLMGVWAVLRRKINSIQ